MPGGANSYAIISARFKSSVLNTKFFFLIFALKILIFKRISEPKETIKEKNINSYEFEIR